MMWATKERHDAICDGTAEVEPRFLGGYPEWPTLDRIGAPWTSRLTPGAWPGAWEERQVARLEPAAAHGEGSTVASCRGISLMPEAQDREKAPHRQDRPLCYQLSWCHGSFSGT
jgi:hypothetical protein